jgi:CheY-like chemotaxis protein
VFLIDSDESVRVTHETILRSEGYEIVSAADGARALAQIRESPPALLLAGERIGSMSPTQLVRVVKHDAALREVRVAIYCASLTLGAECTRAGADAVFAVPVRAEDLVKETVALIGRA